VELVIDTPRGSFLKRRDDGSLDYVSPLPSPYNYGSVPQSRSPDGDRIDVMLLGPRVAPGTTLRAPIRAIARFVDAGVPDPKWVAATAPLSRADQAAGSTRYEGLQRVGPR
jgi:inorganic pyrophosphatase